MATALEQAFITTVNAAASVRQSAYNAAYAAYAPNGFGVFANLATYQAAIVAADNAFIDAVQAAATTAALQPTVVGGLYPGVMYGRWASLTT